MTGASATLLRFSLTLEQARYLSWCLLYASWNEHFASADHIFLNSELAEMFNRRVMESSRETADPPT